MITRPLFLTLVVVLVFQLLSLQPHIFFPQISTGSFTEALKKKYLTVTSPAVQTSFAVQTTRAYDSFVFVGDVMLARNVEFLMDAQGSDYPYRALPLRSLGLQSAIIGNFEASMAVPHRETPPLHMKFSVDTKHVEALQSAGFTHVSLANNHSLDYGPVGFKNTTQALLAKKIQPFGHNAELGNSSITYLEASDEKIALIGINTTSAIPSRETIEALLNQAGAASKMQIIYIHWGNEYETKHSESQELFARELIAAGADLIIGHHPHVVQDIGLIDGVPVFYSLGNYIFDQYFSPEVMQGLVLLFSLTPEPTVYLIPVDSASTLSQPTLMEQPAAKEFLDSLAKRSHPALASGILSNTLYLNDFVASSTKMAIIVR